MSEKGYWFSKMREILNKENGDFKSDIKGLAEESAEAEKDQFRPNSVKPDRPAKKQDYNPDEFTTSNYEKRLEAEEGEIE